MEPNQILMKRKLKIENSLIYKDLIELLNLTLFFRSKNIFIQKYLY